MTSPTPPSELSVLKGVRLFQGFNDSAFELLAEHLRMEKIQPGAKVVSEGDEAREMFVVLDGELEVLKRTKTGSEIRVALLGPGGWFGEMSIIDPHPRSASVRAVAPTKVLRMSAAQVEELLFTKDPKTYATFLTNIAKELSRRLRVADGIIAQLVGSVAEEYVPVRGVAPNTK